MEHPSHYSFLRLTGISGNLESYHNMLKNCTDNSGNWNRDYYLSNRKKLENWIIRAVGDALKYGNTQKWIFGHFIKILAIYNHNPKTDQSIEYLKNLIEYIKREARYHPYGICWQSVSQERMTKWVNWRSSFCKDSDWRLYCAIDLFGDISPDSHEVNIYLTSNLDRTAGMDPQTRKRALNRLAEAGWISWKSNNNERGITIKHCKYVAATTVKTINKLFEPSNPEALSASINIWYKIHRLLSGRPPLTRPHPVFPLIYTKDKLLYFQLGTVSIRQLIAAYLKKSELNAAWKSLRPDSGSFHLHRDAYNEILTAPRKMPYPLDTNIEDNQHFKLLIEYQEKVAWPAMDKGIPFDIRAAKKLRFRLLMAYYGQDPNPLNVRSEKSKIKSRLKLIAEYINAAQSENDERIRPRWDVRGTKSDRTVLKHPDIQNIPKDLRFLLQNQEEILEWHDIKGQEIYITIMESNSANGKSLIEEGRDLMQEIALALDLNKKTVKQIIHSRQRGKGLRKLKQEFGHERVEQVLQHFYHAVPETLRRKKELEGCVLDMNGRLPETPLGRMPVTIDRERITTCASAIFDQSIGAELVKRWAIRYAQTEEGAKAPTVLDMHDALVLTRPREEKPQAGSNRKGVLDRTLKRAAEDLGYEHGPRAEEQGQESRRTAETGEAERRTEGETQAREPGQNTYNGILGEILSAESDLLSCKKVLVPP